MQNSVALRVYCSSNLYLDYKALNQWFIEQYSRSIAALSVSEILSTRYSDIDLNIAFSN
ncbi:hypothetical protein K432DRAFT_383664 [Lepidopterella palustris CBS 459.81]|uniref:ARS-binding protein 1 N-terminal domain-containing protein n=1 Tax=Lepidopterella palustris CBS 459.81 TaxID=1314670 RepID=A0A8E2JE64_9PEZI|nr:hypothetical protein K432DRAFT_383664 [Lepidopterella palustris CBS 459.81]